MGRLIFREITKRSRKLLHKIGLSFHFYASPADLSMHCCLCKLAVHKYSVIEGNKKTYFQTILCYLKEMSRLFKVQNYYSVVSLEASLIGLNAFGKYYSR